MSGAPISSVREPINRRIAAINPLVLMGLGWVWLALVAGWAGWLLRPGRRSILLPPRRRRAVPWGGAEVLVAFLIAQLLWPALLSPFLNGIGFFHMLYGPDFHAADKGAASVASLWLADLSLPLTLVSIPALFYALSGTRPYQLGLTAKGLGKNVLLGLMTAVCVVPVVYLILAAVNWLLRGVGEVPEEHPLTKLVREHPPVIDLVVGGFAALVAAPLVEELLFRGVVQPWCRTRAQGGYLAIAAALLLALGRRFPGLQTAWQAHEWARAWPELLPVAFVLVMVPGYLAARTWLPAAAGAVYATALLFAAAHSFAWPSPVPLFFFALALGLLRYRTQSLVPSVVTHGLFNGVAWALLLMPSHPADKPKKGRETTDARPRPALVSTSSTVPGSLVPART